MALLTWDGIGEKRFETGVDHGVLYMPNESGVYDNGVAWNGLTGVTQTPTGAEANKTYADNIVYGNLISAEEFGATVTAYTYPDEFAEFNGEVIVAPGVTIGQQPRRTFGFSYRSLVGDDIVGQAAGYKLHLVYGLTAAPSEKAYATVNDSPEMIEFSWEFTSVPVGVTDYAQTSVIEVDSTTTDPAALATLEALLYGASGDPQLPTPDEVIAIVGGSPTATNVTVAGAAGAVAIGGTTTNVRFTVEEWDGSEFVAVEDGVAVSEAAAEALVLTAGIHRVSLSATAGNYIPAAQANPFYVTVS
jgi:hypothetical protein